jgi:hypothetical protein
VSSHTPVLSSANCPAPPDVESWIVIEPGASAGKTAEDVMPA